MLGWGFTNANGFLLDNGGGSDNYVYVPTDDSGNPLQMPASSALVVSLADVNDHVGVDVFGSGDLNSAWRVYVDGTSVYIGKRTYGTDAGSVASAAHGLSAGVPFTLDIRPTAGTGTTIEVRLNNSPTVLVSHDITSSDSFAGNSGYGFDSSVDGARVPLLSIAQLIPTYSARADIPWFVCGGEWWVSLDGRGLTLIKRRVMVGTGLADGDTLDQKVYAVDGQNAVVFDPEGDMSIGPWTPSAGELPGHTTDGTTDATICRQVNGRLLVNEEQNVFASAIDNALDYDVGVVSPGAAWDFATAIAGKIGQPIKALLRLGSTTLLVGCSRSIWLVSGDPALGQIEISAIDESVGITGKDAMIRVQEGLALVHSTQGLYVVQGSGVATPLSKLVLTSIIVVDTVGTEFAVSMARDLKRSGTLIFLTPIAGGAGIHVWYDEKVGKFLPPTLLGTTGEASTGGGGGYFPEQYPARVGPMCAMEFDGRVLMGGRDGYIYTFDESVPTDDGDVIDSRMAMLVLHEDDLIQGVKLQCIDTMLADWSGPVQISVYSGQTPEEAYEGTSRALRRQVVSSPKRQRHTIGVSAPAIIVEVSGVGQRWALEPMQATTMPAPMRRTSYLPRPAPPLPCGVTVPGNTGPGSGTGPGPGDPVGGGGSKCMLCDLWMDANQTDMVSGSPVVQLATGATWSVAVNAGFDALDFVLAANICDLPMREDIVMIVVDSTPTVYSGTKANLLANPEGIGPYTVYFSCVDQGL